MILKSPRLRSGITLTEILIAILIMGIGLISLATLFPLGLMRVRNATRANRSALLTESAVGEIQARGLLDRSRFGATPYYGAFLPSPYFFIDPFVQDTVSSGGYTTTDAVYRGYGIDGMPNSINPVIPGPGLPVVYDPLWRMETQAIPFAPALAPHDGRFGVGIGRVRNDPTDGGPPGAWGLQRITNFPFGDPSSMTDPARTTLINQYATIGRVFASPDDIVFQQDGDSNKGPGYGSPLAPDMSTGPIMSDWNFTWIFTGQRSDATDATVLDGDIVTFHNRPLAIDGGVAAGERVVEAVFAYSASVDATGGPNTGYSMGDDRTVLLRWPIGTPDPDVRVGNFIADVTYERSLSTSVSRFGTQAVVGQQTFYPGQRCYWYRIVKKTPAEEDPQVGGHRRMIVSIDSPVRAKTLLNPNGTPIHINVALVSPYVVNVYARVFHMK